MKSPKAVTFAVLLLPIFLLELNPLNAQTTGGKAAKTDPTNHLLLATMEKELSRGQAELAKQDPAPYYTSYSVTDGETLVVMGSQGGVLTSNRERRRVADVSMRIGKPDLDRKSTRLNS